MSGRDLTPTPPCCEVWPELSRSLAWFRTPDGRYRMMPSIPASDGGPHWRVNHCPSCGAPRRSTVEEVET